MASIEGALLDFKRLDRLAAGETPLHRLDPRAKVLTTLLFVLLVVSFDRYEISALFPYFLFPAVLIGIGGLPAGYLARKVLLLSPFALTIALFNPVLDRTPLFQIGSLAVTGGWVSCASIMIRFALTVTAALVLLALTGFPAICDALERLGMPQLFAVQLLFLYRYIFVLTEEGGRVSRARELRSFGKKGQGLRVYASLAGHLLLRTWLRADRVHMAMLARGFTGSFRTPQSYRFGAKEALYLLGWSALLILFRMHNAARLLGSLITGLFA